MVDAKMIAEWLRQTDRPPLPPGDPVSWGVLTHGTLLQGAPWIWLSVGATPDALEGR